VHGDVHLKLVILWWLVPTIKKWGCGKNGYVYVANSQVAYVGANLILACKFFMLLAHHKVKGNEPIYKLSKETLEVIQSILDSA
jgi:hypothetical protein